jgi:uncharacterized protein YjdB
MRWIVDSPRRSAAALVIALAILAACDGRPDILHPDGRRFTVVGPQSVAPSTSVTYVVEGDLDPSQVVDWTSSRPDVLAPNGEGGGFVALAPGVATVRARAGFRTATLDVTVAPEVSAPQLEVVAVGDTVLRAAGDTVRIRARWRHSDGTTADAAAAWASSDTAVATVSAGLVTARGAGRTVIRAMAGGASAELGIRAEFDAPPPPAPVLLLRALGDTLLTSVGDTVRMHARVVVAGDTVIPTQVAWTSTDAAVATVGGGLVTARGAGRAVIRATVEGVHAELAVRVVLQSTPPPPPPPAPVLLLRALGDTLLTSVGDTVRMHARLVVGPGDTVPAPNPVWTSGTPESATVASGLVTARSNGRAVITVRVGDLTRSLAVRVTQVPTRVVLAQSEYAIHGIGASVQLHAEARDARDHAVPGVALTWSSSDPSRVAVSGSGLASGVAFGSAAVAARAGTLSASATVRVTGGVAPEIRGLRAGITNVGDEPSPSYALVQFELRDPDRDMDSVVVQLLDAGGAAMLRYVEPITRGVDRHPFALHAAATAGAARARIRAFDAGGNVTVRDVDLRAGDGPGAPRIEYIEATRIGSDSVEVFFEAADAELDTEIAWLLGFDAAGQWTFVEGFVLEGIEWPEWAAEVGARGSGVAAAVRFAVVLVDAQSNLSRVVGTEGTARSARDPAVRTAPETRRMSGPESRVRTRPLRIDAVRR